MKFFCNTATLLIFTSLALSACQAKSEKNADIYNTLMTSDYFVNNATKISCSGNATFPVTDNATLPDTDYEALCLKMKSQTVESEEQAGDIGIALGMEVSTSFNDTDWELQTESPDGTFYQKLRADGCFDRLFIGLDQTEDIDVLQDNYPFEFAPILAFYKSRQPACNDT